jgi:hypothetical protein
MNMSNKAPASKTMENAMPAASRRGAAVARQGLPALQPSYPFEGALGNQALAQLLQTGVLQAELRVSQPGDPDEQEADRVASQIVAATHAPKIQRKCACAGSGSPCPKCDEEETATIHRSVAPLVRSSQLGLQRAPAGDGPTNSLEQTNPPKPSPTPAHSHPLVVEDDAKSAALHQMRKSAFIALLRSDACATADAVLTSVGHTTKSCPYIEKWLAFYEKQSSEHIERAILKYAPETGAARSAHEAIRLVVMRVQRAALTWAKTGKVSGLPEDLASQLPGQGMLGAVHSFASSSVGGAILGFLGGSKPEKSAPDTAAEKSPAATISRKASNTGNGVGTAHDASAVRSQLGSGYSLDSRVQSQMSSALGHDFSHVRVHTDERASALSSNLNARAFTIGSDVAFASGEYRPGTPVGDALIAHELAHIVQQSGVAHSSSHMHKAADTSSATNESASSQLEIDADLSAVGAIATIWAGAKHGLSDIRQNAVPRLRSGLRLQRCGGDSKASKGKSYEDYIREGNAKLSGVAFGAKGTGELALINYCNAPLSNSSDPKKSFDYWYDNEYWNTAVDTQLKSCKLVLKPSKKPHEAIDQLFDRQDKWHVACAEFIQIVELYALRHTLGDDAFDQRVGGTLELRRRESTGVKTKMLYSRTSPNDQMTRSTDNKLEPSSVEQLVAQAPIGSRIRWTNRDPKALGQPFENENTVKLGQDKFAAHPLTHPKFLFIGGGNEYSRAALELKVARETNPSADRSYVEQNLFISEIEYFDTP